VIVVSGLYLIRSERVAARVAVPAEPVCDLPAQGQPLGEEA
jgi:hypothetical protein